MTTQKTVSSPEARLRELDLALPPLQQAAGTYVRAVRTGSLIFLAGHPPVRPDGSIVFGKLGLDLDVDAGYQAARFAALGTLVTLRDELGSLDRVRRIVKVNGWVNATAEFRDHTATINGASDLLVEVFGEAGRHARLAVGCPSLPWDIALEVELVAEVAD